MACSFMSPTSDHLPFYARMHYRIVTGVFGLFLFAVGVFALFFADTEPTLRWIAGGVILIFSLNMILSAWRAKESWLSKIGPLP